LTRNRALPLFSLSSIVAAVTFAVIGTLISAQAAAPVNWMQASTTQAPPGRAYAAMSYDSARSRTVLFGGSSNPSPSSNLADTWEWNGTNWTQRAPSTSPPGLVAAAMVYDSGRSRSVLFGGGSTQGTVTNATWEWDGTTWTQRSPLASPAGRLWHAMAFDSVRGVTVLFGGNGQGVDLGDTWVFDGTNWTQRFPTSSPSPRFGHAMAFDSIRQRVVLFGGRSNGVRLADTWEWDGSNWSQISPSSTPFPRFWHTMVFDSARGKTVMFGGDHVSPNRLGPINDTWEWDGNTWTQDLTSAAPSPRAGQSMAYDSGRRRTIVFGGTDEGFPGVFYNDTWELGTTDTDLALSGVPTDITISATSPNGAVVRYTMPSAVDEAGDSPAATVACSPASGSTFPIGTTTVTCTATDADDTPSAVSQTFNVTVLDTDLALSGMPANITVDATTAGGAVVTYATPTAVDEAGEQLPAANCAPASGSTFAVGTTTVTCTASSADDSPATASATFTITAVVDLDVAASVTPSTATTGTLVKGTISLANDAAVSRTVTVVAKVDYVSPNGQIHTFTSSKVTIKLSAGQTVSRSNTFKVTRDLPRGTYTFVVTASDVTGSTSSSATFTVT